MTLPSQSIAPLAPFLQEAFGISRAEIGLLSTAGISGALVSMPVAGRLGNPLKLSRGDEVYPSPPAVGQHTDEVLGGILSLSATELAQLRADGVI